MATKNTFNEFGTMMVENRPTMAQLDSEEMTRNEWRQYLHICDNIAISAFNYISGHGDKFADYRTSLHALFTFVEVDTRILALDAYSMRFIPALVPYKVVKSTAYKQAEKAVRTFKKSIAWACDKSGADVDKPTDVLFGNVKNMAEFADKYFSADHQNEYNAIALLLKRCLEADNTLTVADLTTHLNTLESHVDTLAAQPWQCYKDYKNPMISSTGKLLNHLPASLRKNLEDVMADMLEQRALMSLELREKEEKQIKGGRKA